MKEQLKDKNNGKRIQNNKNEYEMLLKTKFILNKSNGHWLPLKRRRRERRREILFPLVNQSKSSELVNLFKLLIQKVEHKKR